MTPRESSPDSPLTLYVFDVSSASLPVLLNEGMPAEQSLRVHSHCVAGDFLYASLESGNVAIFDISTPEAPILISSFQRQHAGNLTVYDGLLAVAYGSGQPTFFDPILIDLYNLSDPNHPVYISTIEGTEHPRRIQLKLHKDLLTSLIIGSSHPTPYFTMVWDIRTPGDSQLIHSTELGQGLDYPFFDEDRLFMLTDNREGDNNEALLFDSHTGSVQIVSKTLHPRHRDYILDNHLQLSVTGTGETLTYDAGVWRSDPGGPGQFVEIKTVTGRNDASQLIVKNDRAGDNEIEYVYTIVPEGYLVNATIIGHEGSIVYLYYNDQEILDNNDYRTEIEYTTAIDFSDPQNPIKLWTVNEAPLRHYEHPDQIYRGVIYNSKHSLLTWLSMNPLNLDEPQTSPLLIPSRIADQMYTYASPIGVVWYHYEWTNWVWHPSLGFVTSLWEWNVEEPSQRNDPWRILSWYYSSEMGYFWTSYYASENATRLSLEFPWIYIHNGEVSGWYYLLDGFSNPSYLWDGTEWITIP